MLSISLNKEWNTPMMSSKTNYEELSNLLKKKKRQKSKSRNIQGKQPQNTLVTINNQSYSRRTAKSNLSLLSVVPVTTFISAKKAKKKVNKSRNIISPIHMTSKPTDPK